MRKREYESKLYAWRSEIKFEEKQLKEMEKIYFWKRDPKLMFSYYEELENKVFEKRERIEWMKKMLLIIEYKKIAPKARKSDTLYNFKNYGK